jgi:hypothetical protein
MLIIIINNMFTHFIAYLGISVGCSALWSLSEIFAPIRNIVAKYFPSFLRKMLLCMECSSFWIGCFVSLFILSYPNFGVYYYFNPICGGITTFLVVKILNNLNFLDKKIY